MSERDVLIQVMESLNLGIIHLCVELKLGNNSGKYHGYLLFLQDPEVRIYILSMFTSFAREFLCKVWNFCWHVEKMNVWL